MGCLLWLFLERVRVLRINAMRFSET